MTNTTATKNIFQKIQTVRAELVKLNLKKSGKNTYSNFMYFELGDFLPALNKLNDEHGITTQFNIEKDKATLKVFNSEKPEEFLTYYSPTAEVEIGKKANGTGGAEPIQNLGGKITYMRRYLMMMAFEIAESDYIDQKDQSKNQPPQLPEEHVKRIEAATDLDNLADICKDIKEKTQGKFEKSLITYYTKKKAELSNKGGAQ